MIELIYKGLLDETVNALKNSFKGYEFKEIYKFECNLTLKSVGSSPMKLFFEMAELKDDTTRIRIYDGFYKHRLLLYIAGILLYGVGFFFFVLLVKLDSLNVRKKILTNIESLNNSAGSTKTKSKKTGKEGNINHLSSSVDKSWVNYFENKY